ncbi:hypothetical protein Tco_1385039 [Tanacetum coccineum]
MHISEPQSEQSSDDTQIQDVEHDSDPEDINNAYLPKVQTQATWFRPIPKEDIPTTPEPEWTIPSNDYPEPENNWANMFATTYQDPEENKLLRNTGDMGSFIKWFCKRTGKKKLRKANLEDKVDLLNPEGHQILRNVYEPLPLGGPPGQVTIQPQFFFNKDLDYLLSGDKDRHNALSISNLKAAHYQDFGLEELVPSLWIKIRSHMRILSVISIKTYERYSYNYLREIVLRRAYYKEYKIAEKDFKNLHPSDFKDLNILHFQGKLDHLSKQDKVHLHNAVNLWTRNIVIRKRVEDLQLGIESYQTKLDLEQPNWDASDFLFREDYTINEVHKFRDGTLMRIRDKLAFMVKDFRLFEFNKGMENMKWTEDDKRRIEDFIEVIERRLKIRRIFRSLESFVSGRLRDIDYRLINRT